MFNGTMKRKNNDLENEQNNGRLPKTPLLNPVDTEQLFRTGLFDHKTLQQYTTEYSNSNPYKHGIIQDLFEPHLLRSVRDEIQQNISFTPKETDIYKIHQSGDLANLDGITDDSLKLLPSLIVLRNALYSVPFRKYISSLTASGPLSASKTDMAVNVYTPGCHLLCHDDVIGSRRVSYILYLTDPDQPWKPEWGGALRLYPTQYMQDARGIESKFPEPDFAVSILPSFNQLAFFAVQPSESFHDVEEVYACKPGESEDDARVRMAISGWYHVPQAGEEDFEAGKEESLSKQSSLAQLQGDPDEYDLPRPQWLSTDHREEKSNVESYSSPSEADLDFLLKYMNPIYLVPDTLEQLSSRFTEESSVQLASFLSTKFETALKTSITKENPTDDDLKWNTARPPHKHRFKYMQVNDGFGDTPDQLVDLVDNLFPSQAFKKWLTLATNLTLAECNIIARRFRRGMDYTLATGYEEPEPQLEVCLGLTPTKGLSADETHAQLVASQDQEASQRSESDESSAASTTPGVSVGGYEVYMVGDEDEDEDDDSHDFHSVPATQSASYTGAGDRRHKADPAVYRSGSENDDDSVLFSMPACWNTMSIVLRDKGVLKFVKYISRSADGDRWDVCGEWKMLSDAGDEGSEEDA